MRTTSTAFALAAVMLLGAAAGASAEDKVKLAIGQRGNWDTSVSEVGQRAGIFKKRGLALEIVYTQGAGETQQAVIAMEEGTREVEVGFRVTSQAGESLREIAAVSQKAAGLAQDISVSTQEQVKGAEHVGLAVQAIAGVALQTEQSDLQTRKTVDDLVRLSQELSNVLSRFKLAA